MFTEREQKLFVGLDSPVKIQDFLDTLKINFEKGGETCMSPRRVLRTGKAHCMEGAMFAAAALQYQGHKPLVMDLRAKRPDDDHIVTVFKQAGYYGGISKTNHAVLRYREPIYKTIRELALSYFHEYFTNDGKKTLREYSAPFDLSQFDHKQWQTSEKDLWYIPKAIDKAKHFNLIPKSLLKKLRPADPIEIAAGKLVEYKK